MVASAVTTATEAVSDEEVLSWIVFSLAPTLPPPLIMDCPVNMHFPCHLKLVSVISIGIQ